MDVHVHQARQHECLAKIQEFNIYSRFLIDGFGCEHITVKNSIDLAIANYNCLFA